MDEITMLAIKTGKSKGTIYRLAKKFNRLPTIEEVLLQKCGRPKKYTK